MGEGGLEAPTRHALAWRAEDFADRSKIEAEMRRVFDICHSCRRCFNLCDAFPRLFDLIDESPIGELESVARDAFASVVDACTLCDMCFMTKCPYVPPHAFNVDFPHLMLRARAASLACGEIGWVDRAMADTDRNGKAARFVAPLVNWATARKNRTVRWLMEKLAGIHREAELPRFHRATFLKRSHPDTDAGAPARGRKAILFATCFVNYNNPRIGESAAAVLAQNGVETVAAYPGCCGMPQLEHGDLGAVAAKARKVAAALIPWIEQGHDVIAPVPSCGLMLKSEWPLILPEEEAVARLADATRDICEYVVDIARNEGLAGALKPLPGGIALHLACHARAQNIGAKAAELLRLIPDTPVEVMERCSGHGGSWGVKKENFEVALKVGRPVARKATELGKAFVASECPLAAAHIVQGMACVDGAADGNSCDTPPDPKRSWHPIELFARACGATV